MSAIRRELGPSLVEGVGIFVLAFFGADVLFGPEADGLDGLALVIPALALGIGTVAWRLETAAKGS